MAGIIDEYESLIELIIDAYTKLQTLDPNHELLGYLENVNDSGFLFVATKLKEFEERFKPERKTDHPRMVTRINYHSSLKDALDKIKWIDRNKQSSKPSLETSIEKSSTDNLPF